MSEPRWIDCTSVADVAAPEELAALTHGGRHVVLRFAQLTAEDRAALIERLAAALPDACVFGSGVQWVTIKPVISAARVREREPEARAAIADYRRTCAELVEQHQRAGLPAGWDADEHGGHCRFTHLGTGQIVEAPLDDHGAVDPYFFALFVQSTPRHAAVAALLDDPFHDAARLLDYLDVP